MTKRVLKNVIVDEKLTDIVIENGKKVFDKDCTYEEYLDTLK
jgi:hypothetical protein